MSGSSTSSGYIISGTQMPCHQTQHLTLQFELKTQIQTQAIEHIV